MKILTSILIVATMFITNNLLAQNKTITATVINVTSDTGKVSYGLYDKESFMKKPIRAKSSKIEGGKSTVIFKNVPVGEYAIICFHDKNGNEKMDFKSNGMPIEDYGSSNNVILMGPPKYESSKFVVADKNVTLEIKF